MAGRSSEGRRSLRAGSAEASCRGAHREVKDGKGLGKWEVGGTERVKTSKLLSKVKVRSGWLGIWVEGLLCGQGEGYG